MKSLRRIASLVSGLLFASASAGFAAPMIPVTDISRVFAQISASPSLANPSMILIDRSTGEVVFEKDALSLRKPASVLKLLSTTAALQFLDPNYRYVTRISRGANPRTLVISGDLDPWMSSDYAEATKYHRAWLPYLANRAISDLNAEEKSRLRNVAITYSGLYSNDVAALKNYFRARGVTAKFAETSSNHIDSLAGQEIASVTSPTINDMVEFALTWSDNLLAERLARAASHAAGLPMNDDGVAQTIKKMLTDLQVNQSDLYIHDGSGLSKQDRVTARLIADLLLKIRGDERFAGVYAGLPVSGISGTLESRFINTAPQAVGLVHAKTGTLDGTVSLAGYVESGTHEYVFVAIADHIQKGQVAADRARNTLDRLLGKITAPLASAALTAAKN